MHKKAAVISIISIIIVITLGIVFSAARRKTRQDLAKETTITKQMETTVITPEALDEIDTSHWKTYRNEEFGFEVRHPAEADGWVYRSPAYRKFTPETLKEYQLELKKYEIDQWVYQTKDNLFGPYDVLGLGSQFEGEWSILVSAIPKKIDDLLMDENYSTQKYWDIRNRESVVLAENGLKGEKVTWTNNAISLYIQKDDYPLTIKFSGYTDLSKAGEEEKNESRAHNMTLFKIISSFTFIGN